MSNKVSKSEILRNKKLESYSILDSEKEELFDDLTRLASKVFGTPVSLLSLIHNDRQWFKSTNGTDITETPRSVSFCTHIIDSDNNDAMVVNDATKDERFVNNPLVAQDPNVRFYVGTPLITDDGYKIGTICALDMKPQEVTADQLESLRALARHAVYLIEMRKLNIKLATEKSHIESQLNSVLESLDDVIWSVDINTFQPLYLSQSVVPMTGYNPSELDNDITKTIIKEDRNLIRKFKFDLRLHGKAETTVRISKKSGEIAYITSRARVVSEHNKPVRIDGVSFDVTQMKHQEQTILEQNAQITMSAKMSALGELSSSIAHEIKNPLNVINNCAGFLIELCEACDTVDKTEILDASNKIEATVERIAKIIKSLKSYSRDSESDPLTIAPLNPIFAEVHELCANRFWAGDVKLEIKAVDENLLINCRPSQIYQVLVNLINNSFDAVENLDERWVKVSVANPSPEAPNMLEIYVDDSGTTMTEALYNKIFQAYYTTKEIGKGTGLGLSISKKIIEDHGGQLSVDLKHPTTRFVIRLPNQLGME